MAASSRARPGLAGRIFAGALILVLTCVIVLLVAAGFFTFRIVLENNTTENVTPASFLLSHYESLGFVDSRGGEHDGWLLRGLKGAPVVILCPGHDSNRSDLLSLGAVLQENHFNVYIFNFRGPKTKHTLSDLGIQQAGDLQSAIDTITKQPDINPHRVGLFGSTTGGYAVLADAPKSPLIKAIVVDSVYEIPTQMLDAELDQFLGGPSPVFRTLVEMEFHVLNWGAKPPPIREELSNLQGMPKLFISGRDIPMLASITEDFYTAAPQPKKLLVLEHTYNAQASGAEQKEYENQVLGFFLQNLPLRAD